MNASINYESYVWQLEKHKPIFRITTNDHKVARKLMKKENVFMLSYGIQDSTSWTFQTSYESLSYAVIGLGSVTNADVVESSFDGIFVSYTPKQSKTNFDISKIMNENTLEIEEDTNIKFDIDGDDDNLTISFK